MTHQTARQSPSSRLVEIEPMPALDILGMLRVVWNGKWVIALTMICCVLLAGYYAFRMTQPRFVATATLQIDVQPTTFGDLSRTVQNPGTDIASLNTQVAILKSNQLLGQVVHSLDLLADPEFNRYLNAPSPLSVTTLRGQLRNLLSGTENIIPDSAAIFEKTIQNLRGVISVEQPRDTYILRISANSRSAEKAEVIANTLAATYLMDQIHAKDAASQEAERWLTGRVDALQIQLQTQETAITGLISQAQVQEDTALDNLSNQVFAIDQQLDAAHDALGIIQTASGATATPRLQAEVTRQRTRIAALTSQRDRLLTQLSAQSEGLVTLHQLQRQADATQVLYETFLARLQETRIQRGLENPDSRLISGATKGSYLGPRKTFILALSLVVGALLGLTIVTLQHTLRRGVFDAITLRQETGIPVIAQVSRSNADRTRGIRKLLKRARPVYGKAMQDLRTALAVSAKGQPSKTIMLTSSIQNEGKTGYAIALAQSFGRAGKSVLLLSADSTSALPSALGWQPKVGMHDVLTKNAALSETINRSPRLPADLLHIGQTNAGDSVFLADRFTGFMTDLAARYDHIIIDAPPVMTAPETQLLAQFADSVIYCVAWSKTPLALVHLGLNTLHVADAPATGLILSKVNARKMRRFSTSPYFNAHTMPLAT